MLQKKRICLAKSDWLASNTIYYNKKNRLFGHNINNVIDFGNIDFDAEGLLNYLDFGYSVFGRTPVKDVFYLRSNHDLFLENDNQLVVGMREDKALTLLGESVSEPYVWHQLKLCIEKISCQLADQRVLIPTSGGYDSRLLNFFFPEKKQILALTYGLSEKQSKSFEVVHAQEICRRLGIKWHQIELGEFHNCFSLWDERYGISTHAHGMYQIEFYQKIRDLYGTMPVLSGIIGDAWAGSPRTVAPKRPEDLVRFSYSHGMHADSSQCLLKSKRTTRENEFLFEKENLKDERYRILYLVRTKMILLSYLLEVPRMLGFYPVSPFLEMDVALPMLNIESLRWRNRVWQTEFIEKNGLNVEVDCKNKSSRNDLNILAILNHPPKPLNTQLLSQLFKLDYLNWINNNLQHFSFVARLKHTAFNIRYIGRVLRLLGIEHTVLNAYFAYLTLKPIESILIKAKKYHNDG